MENLERFSRESHYFFLPFSIFSLSPFLQFSQNTKLLLSFLPLQICVNPRLSAAKKSFPCFLFFRFPSFLRLSYFKPLNSYKQSFLAPGLLRRKTPRNDSFQRWVRKECTSSDQGKLALKRSHNLTNHIMASSMRHSGFYWRLP